MENMSALAEKAMASGFNLDLVVHDGLVQAKFMVDKIKRAKTFAIREDDIFLCTYPKSGTHWTWEILNMIVAGKAEYTKHWLNSAYLESRTKEELEKLESPRIIHTHLLPSQMPDAIWTNGCKVVYVHRHPKDCLVSFFSQLSKQIWEDNPLQKTAFSGSWADYLDLFLDGYTLAPCGSYFTYRLQMSTISDTYKGFEVCTVRYEDMKAHCAREIKRMAEYLGRPLPEQIYRDISEACSFKNLKNACETMKDQTYHYKWQDGSSGYFRKGECGDWKNFFTVAQSERFDKMYEEKMQSPLL
ncbi:sulfotransferase 1C2A-like [Haliotis asinina]|uniref:sulfotransferase 1C2A-like n=1 Tax=Haliotis asinina TaxID=109174 RepID=UPI003531F4C5